MSYKVIVPEITAPACLMCGWGHLPLHIPRGAQGVRYRPQVWTLVWWSFTLSVTQLVCCWLPWWFGLDSWDSVLMYNEIFHWNIAYFLMNICTISNIVGWQKASQSNISVSWVTFTVMSTVRAGCSVGHRLQLWPLARWLSNSSLDQSVCCPHIY